MGYPLGKSGGLFRELCVGDVPLAALGAFVDAEEIGAIVP